MNIEWPEGAQFYIKPRLENRRHKEGFFARTCTGCDTLKDGLRIDGQQYEVYTQYWEVTPRPTAPWPQAGVECEFSLDAGCTYEWCEVLGRHGRAVWLRTRHGYSAFFIDKAIFRPIRTLRDEVFGLITKVIYDNSIEGLGGAKAVADRVADLVMAEFDLTRKQK